MAVKVILGIIFIFGGLVIDLKIVIVLCEDGGEIKGLYCVGEMVGGFFYGNYFGGSGLIVGGVFGWWVGWMVVERVGLS